jgi:hypothetical protein
LPPGDWRVVHGKYGEEVPLPAELGGDLPTADLGLYGTGPSH